MRRPGLALALAAALVLLPPAAAQRVQVGGDFSGEVSALLLRIGGDLRLEANDTTETLWVIGGDVDVLGHVREQLVVIGGTARVSGTVGENIVAVDGRVWLGPAATVGKDVLLLGSTLRRTSGSVVRGRIEQRHELVASQQVLRILWLATTVIALGVALFFTAVGSRQLREAGTALTDQPGETLLATLALWGGGLLLALVLFASVIGLPLALVVLLGLLPLLWILGYVVAGARLGQALFALGGARPGRRRPYLPALAGVLLLQVLGLIPWLGTLIVLFAGYVGSGALALRSWHLWRHAPPHEDPLVE